MKISKIRGSRVLAGLMIVAGISLMGYLWKVWGDRGLYADAHGTSGYTTSFEVVLLVISLLLLVGAVAALAAAHKKPSST